MQKEILNLLAEAARSIHIPLGDRELSLFDRYHGELILWNVRMNLTALRSSEDIVVKHFIDSLTVLPFLPGPHVKLLDVGTGAGFPGIPLKIVLGSLKIHLLESSRKKISFLKKVVHTLSLEETIPIHGRAEDISKELPFQSTFDVVISRATFRLPSWIEVGSPFLKQGGLLIAMKGAKVKEEVEEASKSIERYGLSSKGCHDLRLPFTGHTRNIMIYEKIHEEMPQSDIINTCS
ncbi:MAG: 16S rRNA (guanine(527)-N(7))-methyltransferase RsmG [Deltaproteobacteria bacterium]|nr:16S rRNA (guanine(527)-N(7))-methyltransferase RsmG [Deltaproteobacteria bacterium]